MNNRLSTYYREIEYARLRKGYACVSNFLLEEIDTIPVSLETKLYDDFLIGGDDIIDLLEKFVKTFNLKYGDFHFNNHFYDEYELFGATAAARTVFSLSIYIFLLILLPLSKYQLDQALEKIFQNRTREQERKDLTLREMIIWYLEGEYINPEKIKYRIKIVN